MGDFALSNFQKKNFRDSGAHVATTLFQQFFTIKKNALCGKWILHDVATQEETPQTLF